MVRDIRAIYSYHAESTHTKNENGGYTMKDIGRAARGYKDSFVHTVEAQIQWREGIDVEKKRGDSRHVVTRWKSGKNGSSEPATMRFNPNKERIMSKCSGNMVRLGNCRSLADFEAIIGEWAQTQGFKRDDIDITRADFTLDCYDESAAPLFRKLCDLTIAAFIVRHEISDKHQYWGETTISRRPKNNKAVWGQIELERYNKNTQQPGHGALWRMELRYSKDTKHPDREQPEEMRGMLEALIEELNGLPAYYGAVQEQMNAALLERYEEMRQGSASSIEKNQFLQENNDRIFSRAQVRQFFKETGVNDIKKQRNFANNYSKRHEHLYINKEKFSSFIFCITEEIQKWVRSDPFFEEIMQANRLGKTE